MNMRVAVLIAVCGAGCRSDCPPRLNSNAEVTAPPRVDDQQPPPPPEAAPVPRQVLGKPLRVASSTVAYAQNLTGPVPRELMNTTAMPTDAEVVREVAARFAQPELLRASPQPPDRGLTVWTFTYEGIGIEMDARTVQDRGGYVTRWIPAERGPELKRDELIGADRARTATGAKTRSDVPVLLFEPVFGLRRLPGRNGDNAMDHVRVIASYQLLYEVPLIDDTIVHVDAYTGDLVRHTDPHGGIP